MSEDAYVPADVWQWDPDAETSLKFNRPIAGATRERELMRGDHPFQLYSLGSPNGQKVTIMFEELLAAGFADAEYDAWLIDISRGHQFGSGFVALNPNSKIPALLDCSGPEPFRVFESGAILLHLAAKFGTLIPRDAKLRAECTSWLFWQMSTAPILGGGFGHFYKVAPARIGYAINRYAMEAKRIFDVIDRRLSETRFLVGDEYSIADIAVFAWAYYFHSRDAYGGATRFLDMPSYRNLDRWVREIALRTAVRRGLIVNLPGAGFVHERHSAADIDAVLSG